MAIVNFFDDILSEVTETRKVKNGQKLQSIINNYIEEKDAISVPYEVYDVESGNTSYITPETKEFRTLCLLNGNEQTDLEYKVKGNDIVSFIVIPEDSTQQWVNYLGGGLAIAGGVLLSVYIRSRSHYWSRINIHWYRYGCQPRNTRHNRLFF
ncbi:MAG: hypothetical protein L6V86_09000 [Treponema sp.]|nr:MAG: hypothetical protein L6V86_09000 [Treponema sp.]